MNKSISIVIILGAVLALSGGSVAADSPRIADRSPIGAPKHQFGIEVDPMTSIIRILPTRSRDVINPSFRMVSAICTNCGACPSVGRSIEVTLEAVEDVAAGYGVSDLLVTNFSTAEVTYSTQGPLSPLGNERQVIITIAGEVLSCGRTFKVYFSMCDTAPPLPADDCLSSTQYGACCMLTPEPHCVEVLQEDCTSGYFSMAGASCDEFPCVHCCDKTPGTPPFGSPSYDCRFQFEVMCSQGDAPEGTYPDTDSCEAVCEEPTGWCCHNVPETACSDTEVPKSICDMLGGELYPDEASCIEACIPMCDCIGGECVEGDTMPCSECNPDDCRDLCCAPNEPYACDAVTTEECDAAGGTMYSGDDPLTCLNDCTVCCETAFPGSGYEMKSVLSCVAGVGGGTPVAAGLCAPKPYCCMSVIPQAPMQGCVHASVFGLDDCPYGIGLYDMASCEAACQAPFTWCCSEPFDTCMLCPDGPHTDDPSCNNQCAD